jgi:Protein of unknown function (DUF3105)
MASKTSPRPSGKAGGKPAGKGTGGKPTAKGTGRPGRKPVKPIKPSLPWGMIALGTAVAIFAFSIIGFGIWSVRDSGKPFGERSAQQIDGVKNFRKTEKLDRNHVKGKQTYKQSPPVGGNHNAQWQNCEGDVYTAQIPNEHAVHSLEHGAVWITYRPDLPKRQVDALAKKVKGTEFTMMSPYPGLDKPISLQAWGLQLKVDKASDSRVDEFIKVFRKNATMEPGAGCSQGVTATGTEPQESPTGGMPTGGAPTGG